MEYRPDKIIVHHSAANKPSPQFEAINAWHKARGFPLSSLCYYVGYHVVIEKDGTLSRARGDLERDADALGHNYDSLSVCLAGNFDLTDPTPAQIASLGKLLSEWCARYALGAGDIFPHRQFANKSCYGSRLGKHWAAIVYLKFEVARISALIDALQKPV